MEQPPKAILKDNMAKNSTKITQAAKKYRKIVAKALRDRRLLIIVKIGLMKDFILLERKVK
jgi:hypothetical protein